VVGLGDGDSVGMTVGTVLGKVVALTVRFSVGI
jgi:hypothetical protein